MILYYALGGGLGHLTRARAFLNTLGVAKEASILTSSRHAADIRVTGDIRIIQVAQEFESNLKAYRSFLDGIFEELQIETLFLDSFPVGILGEFSDFYFPPNLEINYLARLLRWENYAPLLKGQSPQFERTFILENLETTHQKFVDENSNTQCEFEIIYPPTDLLPSDRKTYEDLLRRRKPFWLIVHTGHQDEISELLTFAAEMREIEAAAADLILISPDPPPIKSPKCLHFDFYPAEALFPHAQRVFTACGFNAMRQLKLLRAKHHFIPFERRYDNQFARAVFFRENAK